MVAPERLLVADGLRRLVGRDRSLVEPLRQAPQVPAVGVAEQAGRIVLADRGEIGHDPDAPPVKLLERLWPDAPQRLDREGTEEPALGSRLDDLDAEAPAGPVP